ncbi:hypothetical protein DTO027I6_6338 [Penicillium roqueforti]|uniref:uncharacterized protein n=1 Tax=Penicillium roqueforti TaxID=5082 RepID=UPI00190DE42F|nr:uncharacterized protein LCP9604111_5813 [Penicillium roqueforti]KAF9248104.1 hypothetical protein LCP9604111_5813 [Penicillium roqueforti]KAI2714770.1 hypothetical protein CBS147318_6347 [Penicillium roqueforti]KAI3101847.1 hypothetical protein CBS147333_8024 [Penicillium roqueforti]KAI3128061.1 hypothetical protein CBS147330_5520 [Penicillium roqueforti]KAI3165089.1 hypothetical protein DTO039G3_7039 [Penicillium roqueforti]
MATRLSRSLPQVNRRVFARLSSRTTPRVANTSARAGLVTRRNARNLAPWACRVTQANIARYSHTDSGESASPNASISNAADYRGSTITEKHWMSQDIVVVDTLIEPQAVLNFMEFITYGILPNGKKTDLALIDSDEFPLFMTPSSEWAPAPFNKAALPTVQKAMMRITGPEDLSGLCYIGQNIHFVKTRLWGGLAPVSASRWREKDLNNPDHFTIAHEYLTSVIAVFEYLNNPQIRTNMRDTFNKISGDFGEIQDALNARRKAQGGLSPELNLTALWEEYIRAQYEVMTSTAHSWVLARVAELRERTLDSLIAIPAENTESSEMKILAQRWTDLIAVTSMADFNIWMSMDGYNGYTAPSEIIAGLHNPDLEHQDKNYGFSKLLVDRVTKCIEAQNEAAIVQGPSATQSDAARRERLSISTVLQDELREKIRGLAPSPQPPVQPWIQQLLRAQEASLSLQPWERDNYGFGLAIYRTADKFSDEQWATLQRDLEAHLSAWGDDVQGADEIKPHLKLHWFDCKELGFDTANPVTAARRHYQQIRSSEEWNNKIAPSVFLLIDFMGVNSYINDDFYASITKDKALLKGDFQGFVLAVDPDFDKTVTNESADGTASEDPQDEGLEYPGQVRIMGNLVWSELYPMLNRQSVGLTNLWLQAREHPMKVYTGLTVPSQIQPWKELNAMKTHMMDSFVEFLKKKDPTMAGKVKELRKEGRL